MSTNRPKRSSYIFDNEPEAKRGPGAYYNDTESDEDNPLPEIKLDYILPEIKLENPAHYLTTNMRPKLETDLREDPALYLRLSDETKQEYLEAAVWAIKGLIGIPQKRGLAQTIYSRVSDEDKHKNLFQLANYAVTVFPSCYLDVPSIIKLHNWYLLDLAIDCLCRRSQPVDVGLLDYVLLLDKTQIPDLMKQCFIYFWKYPPDIFENNPLALDRIQLFRTRYRGVAEPPHIGLGLAQVWMIDAPKVGYHMLPPSTQRAFPHLRAV